MRAQSSTRGFPAANSCITQTLMPFLYQTKTLFALQPFRPIAHRYLRASPIRSRILLHTSTLRSYRGSATHESDIPIRKVPVGKKVAGVVSRLPERSIGNGAIYKRVAVRRAKQSEDVPWEDDLQSLDQGRKAFTTRRESIPFDSAEDIDGVGFSNHAEPFEEENLLEDDIDGLDYPSEPTARPGRESTITIAERHAFQRIFADILARSKSSGLETDSDYSNDNVSTKASARQKKASDEIGNIMDEAEKTASKNRGFDSRTENKSQQDLRAAVDRYPPPLRKAAAKAIGLVSERSTKQSQAEQEEIVSIEDDLEHIRQPERERVEGLMRAAKTDVEIWQIMENEVFSMVDKLGFGEKPAMQNTSKKSRGRKNKKQTAEAPSEPSPNNDQAHDLTIYGPLYPSHLLLGLRLLDRSFEKPSPLVLNVLPRIKSLGIISHVLGASTALYNELLRIYWFRYDDFLGAEELLNEMDQAGLEFDTETFGIVNDIHSMQSRVRRGDKGPVLQALWSMPEFASGKFKPWKDRIQASLEERDPESSEESRWKAEARL